MTPYTFRDVMRPRNATTRNVAELVDVSRQNMRRLMLKHAATFPSAVHEGSSAVWHLYPILQWLSDHASYSVPVARIKFNWPIICLLWVAPMPGAYSNEEAPLVEQARAICTTNGTIDSNRARKLRDLIRDQESTWRRLRLLRSDLDESISRCASAMNAAYAVFLAGSYVDIGAKLSSLEKYEEAIVSYKKANSLFVKFPYPNVLWLQALRGEALAELSLGNKAAAEQSAATQVALAREWFTKQNSVVRELRYALLFEIELCDKSGNATCSQNSRREADDLQASARR